MSEDDSADGRSGAMDFARPYFGRAVRTTWVLFVVLVTVAFIVQRLQPVPGLVYEEVNGMTGASLFVFRIAVVTVVVTIASGIGAILLSPLGWLLCRLLLPIRSFAVHFVAYAALGAGIGLVLMVLFPAAAQYWSAVFGIHTVGALTLSVPLGWWLTARRALREDPGLIRRREVPGLGTPLSPQADEF
ncbi:hypothetical protein [Microbacterium sp. LWO13-1.2]|uniref:hypothetical protein n=1 Tax=Microbacterium sp. LWO13-1.2 TaxID=3135262 RepID=UPI00313A0609